MNAERNIARIKIKHFRLVAPYIMGTDKWSLINIPKNDKFVKQSDAETRGGATIVTVIYDDGSESKGLCMVPATTNFCRRSSASIARTRALHGMPNKGVTLSSVYKRCFVSPEIMDIVEANPPKDKKFDNVQVLEHRFEDVE
jgi:hypothetical protein